MRRDGGKGWIVKTTAVVLIVGLAGEICVVSRTPEEQQQHTEQKTEWLQPIAMIGQEAVSTLTATSAAILNRDGRDWLI